MSQVNRTDRSCPWEKDPPELKIDDFTRRFALRAANLMWLLGAGASVGWNSHSQRYGLGVQAVAVCQPAAGRTAKRIRSFQSGDPRAIAGTHRRGRHFTGRRFPRRVWVKS